MRKKLIDKVLKETPWELPLNLDLLPRQNEFIFDFAHRFTAYGGGLANGKTAGGCVRAWLLSTMFPGNTGFIGRFDGKELRNTTLSDFRRLLPPNCIEHQNDQMGRLKFTKKYGGSEIYYGDLKEDDFNNINLGWFFVDQAEEIDDARWLSLTKRLRKKTFLYGPGSSTPMTDADGNALFAQTYGFATFNPEGTSSYLWRWFHPDSPDKKDGYHLYEARTQDSVAAGIITQAYVDTMKALMPANAQARYLDGAWDVFEGRVYPAFATDTHVLPAIAVRPHWKIYESIDHGMQSPTAVQWWALDEHGNRFLVDEHYEGNRQSVLYHATVMKGKRTQFAHAPVLTYLDNHCWAQDQSNGTHVYSIADEYAEHGIFAVPGQKDEHTGISRITQGLAPDPAHRHPLTGEYGAPHIYVASHCTHFIREALGYRWKKNRMVAQKNVPDRPIDFNDHHMDAWRYFETSRPQSPIIEVPVERDPLVLWQKQRRAYNPLADANHVGSWMSI